MIELFTRNIQDVETAMSFVQLQEKLNQQPFLAGNWSFLKFDVKVSAGSQIHVPVGVMLPHGGKNLPDASFRWATGDLLNKKTYQEYYNEVGPAFGGDVNNANVPDIRGVVLRGADKGKGLDPDAAARIALNTGGATGDNVGSYQADAMQGHYHQTYYATTSPQVGGAGTADAATTTPVTAHTTTRAKEAITDGSHGTPRVSNESRVKNVAVNYIVKIKPSYSRVVIPHSLKFKPTDFVVSAVLPADNLELASVRILHNDPDTNEKTIALAVDNPCSVRMFVGSYEEKR